MFYCLDKKYGMEYVNDICHRQGVCEKQYEVSLRCGDLNDKRKQLIGKKECIDFMTRLLLLPDEGLYYYLKYIIWMESK